MVYVEGMHLRKDKKNGNCVDYIQLGQEDIIPFVTIEKSDRLCGELQGQKQVNQGFAYDDPYGNLLIWVSLGGRKETTFWPHISVVNLTMVVTAYQKNCKKPGVNFR